MLLVIGYGKEDGCDCNGGGEGGASTLLAARFRKSSRLEGRQRTAKPPENRHFSRRKCTRRLTISIT